MASIAQDFSAPLKIAIIGATGNAGSRITAEALMRGHHVTAVVRDPSRVAGSERLTARVGDVNDPDGLALTLAGHDVAVSATPFISTVPADIIGAMKASGVARYLAIGGAGSLWVRPGCLFVDEPDFPQEVLEESHHGRALLAALRDEGELNWTMLTPAAVFGPGERTATFRLGNDDLIVGADGSSSISYEDFAVALLDEIENARYPQQRFTIGY